MKRAFAKRSALILVLATMAAALMATPAGAAIEFDSLGSSLTTAGLPETRAGSHPDEYVTEFSVNTTPTPPGTEPSLIPVGELKDTVVDLPPGLIGNPTVAPTCPYAVYFSSPDGVAKECPKSSVIGRVLVTYGDSTSTEAQRLYNLEPAHGQAARLGFKVLGTVPVTLEASLSKEAPYHIVTESIDTYQISYFYAIKVTVWGNPADPSHDAERGGSAGIAEKAFLTAPRSCGEPLRFDLAIRSWQEPDTWTEGSVPGSPMDGCNALEFTPTLEARPTTNVADSPTGLDVELAVPQEEITNPDVIDPQSDLRKAVVTLPEGLAVNPSSANGLDACSSSQVGIDPSTGIANGNQPSCPTASKIGTTTVETPLLDHPLEGSVYVAKPHDNPFNSLLAIYIVLDDPLSGTLVKLAGHVVPDPQTGRLTTTFDENPQVPFESFELHFFQGPTAALRTPSTCGTYATASELTPWSAPESGAPATPQDSWSIDQSPTGGACATTAGARPNSPSFDAGAVSPLAGTHSPFVVRLRRSDGSQRFGAVTVTPPPGLVAKLAGVASCPDSALAAARAKSGAQEKASPSCPAASEIGTAVAGAGAGPAPYYATGKAYLTGPYKGAPLSMTVITPAVAGPYDLGTVVVRVALRVDPKTAEITAASDPIPSILQGIPLDVRTLDVSLDRPDFTLNPTSCDQMAIGGQVLSTDSQLASLSSRFQLGECGRLGFKPRMTMRLKGGTKRGAHPSLSVTLTPRAGDANIASLSVALPRSEFLDQAHIRTICTKVQFAADQCPAGAVYGEASVTTRLFDYPLAGHIYLRSSSNELPDLVPDLRGPASQPIRVEAAGRTDSIRGGLRNTFDFVPDAPFTKLVAKLEGGKKGLLQNSRDICAKPYRATVIYTSHNGLSYTAHPLLKAKCKKAKKGTKKAKAKGKGAKRVSG
jgi:hypothetical protein